MGTIPATGYESSVVQTFSSPTGTSHTMTYAANVSDMVLVINNVIQEPTVAYTTSGTTLTTATLVSGDTMYIIYLALSRKTVTPGSSTVTNAMMVDDSINSAEIVNNAVTLAKMAGGTDGNIISYDASGDPVAVVTGSSGQVLTSAGAGAPPTFAAAGGGFTLGTEQATTSGTSITFSSIPSGTKIIIISFFGVSFTASVDLDVTIGDSGGLETASYVSSGIYTHDDDSAVTSASTAEFNMNTASGSDVVTGTMTLTLEDSTNNTWISSHTTYQLDNRLAYGAGSKSLSGELTQLAISGGTFDAGAVNIMYS